MGPYIIFDIIQTQTISALPADKKAVIIRSLKQIGVAKIKTVSTKRKTFEVTFSNSVKKDEEIMNVIEKILKKSK